MKQPTTIFLLLVTLQFLFSTCSGKRHWEVIAIERTGTYHREECPPVKMAKTKLMTVSEAKVEHLKPCPVCKPDTL